MPFSPTNIGNRVLEETFKAGPSTGILPWRVVILDNVATVPYGTGGYAPVKHPSTTFTNGEKTLGVAVGPEPQLVTAASDGLAPASAWAAFSAIAQNRSVNVRLMGTVPILCDNTTDSTQINAGDFVRISTSTTTSISSQTVTMAGTVAKAAMTTNNVVDASQHVVGVAFSRVAPSADSAIFVMTKLQPAEY